MPPKLLGADPEFSLWTPDTDEFCRAENHIRYTSQDTQFGLDGGCMVAELRPRPADDPQEIMKNIRSALRKGLCSSVRELVWRAGAGAGHCPTGGHLHLGLPFFWENRQNIYKLDAFLGYPLIALEHQDTGRARRHAGYGSLGDAREQPWGVEYRTPASWLISPAITSIAMHLAWAVATFFDKLPDPSRKDFPPLTSQARVRSYASQNLVILGALVGKTYVMDNIVRPWMFYTTVLGDWWERRDMRQTWGLLPTPTLNQVTGLRLSEADLLDATPKNGHSNIIWNETHHHISAIKTLCGALASENQKQLWVVGLKRKRGAAVLVSPTLLKHPKIPRLLLKLNLPFKAWPKHPRNQEHVLGLPFRLRDADPQACARLTRLVAGTLFQRIEEEK